MLSLLAQTDPQIVVQPTSDPHTAAFVAIGVATISMLSQVAGMLVGMWRERNKLALDTARAVEVAVLKHDAERKDERISALMAELQVTKAKIAKCEQDHALSIQDRAALRAKSEMQDQRIAALTGRVDSAHTAALAAAKAVETVPLKTAEVVAQKLTEAKQ